MILIYEHYCQSAGHLFTKKPTLSTENSISSTQKYKPGKSNNSPNNVTSLASDRTMLKEENKDMNDEISLTSSTQPQKMNLGTHININEQIPEPIQFVNRSSNKPKINHTGGPLEIEKAKSPLILLRPTLSSSPSTSSKSFESKKEKIVKTTKLTTARTITNTMSTTKLSTTLPLSLRRSYHTDLSKFLLTISDVPSRNIVNYKPNFKHHQNSVKGRPIEKYNILKNIQNRHNNYNKSLELEDPDEHDGNVTSNRFFELISKFFGTDLITSIFIFSSLFLILLLLLLLIFCIFLYRLRKKGRRGECLGRKLSVPQTKLGWASLSLLHHDGKFNNQKYYGPTFSNNIDNDQSSQSKKFNLDTSSPSTTSTSSNGTKTEYLKLSSGTESCKMLD
ncbi:hypothetical protein SNEBB_000751 [Seison nebaliae]|nr:hypothetical protein SNEBB_000751 [Seison nebaliae]